MSEEKIDMEAAVRIRNYWLDYAGQGQDVILEDVVEGLQYLRENAGYKEFPPPHRVVVANSPSEIYDIVGRLAEEVGVPHPGMPSTFQPGAFPYSGFNGNIDYMREKGKHIPREDECDKLRKLITGFDYYHYDNAEIILKHPQYIKWEFLSDGGRRYHCADGPCWEWEDGYKVYFFHGRHIPRKYEWIITTKPEDFTIEQYKSVTDADMRQIIIERVGIVNMVKLGEGKLLDSWERWVGTDLDKSFPVQKSRYELYDMSALLEGIPYKALKMDHLGMGAALLEQVADHCETIEDALRSRMPDFDLSEYTTEGAWTH
jgi:hypothetical protein